MYDELSRSQRRTPLEWIVLNVVVPSVLVTLLSTAFRPLCGCSPAIPRWHERISYEVLPVVTFGSPRVTPVLVSIHQPDYPADMRRSLNEGRVVVKGVVDDRGKVVRSSIVVLQTTDSRFNGAARQAFGSAVFWPAVWGGENMNAPVTMVIEFHLFYRE
ncbi:MAG TPA: TonB family protein [Gemmatimonadales bacterium]|nr:TonB family protein [Gemmatimonadales bacterium]